MSKALSPAQIAYVSRIAGFTGVDLVTAVAVAMAESGGDPGQVSHNTDAHRSTDYGLFQINDYWNASYLTMGNWSDPVDNARMAHAIWASRGWRDWVTFTRGTYRSHLLVARQAAADPQGEGVVTDLGASAASGIAGPLGGAAARGAAGLLGGVADVGKVLLAPAEAVANTAIWVSNRHNWARVAWVMIGASLLIGGMIVLSRPVTEPVVQTVTRGAKRVGTLAAAA